MRAGYIDDIRSACFRDDMPEPQLAENQRDWVKIKVRCCGICGSDLVYYNGKSPLDAHFEVSRLLGHERPDVTNIYLASVRKGDKHGQ